MATSSKGTALVTGASSGIGEALARKLAAEGFDLILTARRTNLLQEIAASLQSEGASVALITADLATIDGIKHVCQQIESLDVQIDILVNNAGILAPGAFEELSEAEIVSSITVNMTALTYLTHYFLPGMLDRRSGRILNVASVAAFHPVPGMHLYAATKSFVLSLSESLVETLKGTGVSVTALCPGLTDTDSLDKNIATTLPPQLIASPELVANEGFDAMMKREAIRIPGEINKLGIAFAQHQPRWLIRSLGGIAAKLSRS